VAHLHDDPEGPERQFAHDLAFEERVEEAEDDEEDERDHGAGLELEEREVAARLLEAALDSIDLLGFGLLGELGGGGLGLHGLQLLGGLVDGRPEGLVGGGAVDEEP
jgi:hypothetical protein